MIRWGFWGSGAVAENVAQDFGLVRGAVLQAVASRTVQNAQRFAALYSCPKHYAGLDALLSDTAIDVVYVATPNHRHMDDAIACMEAGKAVLLEKPFALNFSQAQRIADSASQHKVFCMEGMWTRFIPAIREAKRAIDAGEIGAIRLMQGNFAYPVAEGLESRFFNPELGGGALLDRGVYLISLAQYLLGNPQRLQAVANIGATGVDEQSAYLLSYKSGALAEFSASLRTRGTNEVSISGERGILRLSEPFYRAHRLTLKPFAVPQPVVSGGPRGSGVGALGKLKGAIRQSPAAKELHRRISPLLASLQPGSVRSFPFAGNGYQMQLQHVTDCLQERRLESPIMPLGDSVSVMETIDSLLSQMQQLSPSNVPITSQAGTV